ncbi:MAG: T9SS C-terminal target domain-containing protein [Bacteroidetes bacterium]|nr:MAG: T9SS C-terminal target domain-containing protein [Bacteroidota bacterium]
MKKLAVFVFAVLLGSAAMAQKTGGTAAPQPVENQVRFYPNPATTVVNFEFSKIAPRGSSLQVFSFVGRKVLSVMVTSNRTSINITNLMAGIYVFQLRDAEGRILACNKFQVK